MAIVYIVKLHFMTDAIGVQQFQVKPGIKISLKDYNTDMKAKPIEKAEAGALLEEGKIHLAEMQEKLYAHNRYRILIIFQAMDAAGKDSAVKHLMSGFNPMGVKVYSFKTPTAHELDHDYFWRHYIALPARGEMAIHNRSYYENVLITKVHPEYILNENLPGINTVEDIDRKFWEARYEQINRLEKNLYDNGTIILKFFLHVSRKEQKKRFLERISDPAKNWKFSINDLKERGFWNDYQKAYEEAIAATSQTHAPWFIIPADDKWFARFVIANILYKKFEELDVSFPVLNEKQKAALEQAKEILLKE
jgi:PPK2 family polyphosphate:nucleotide phosphotransferase